MAKLEQKAKKGLYGGFKPGSTGGPGTGKLKNKVNKLAMNLKNKFQANPKPPKTPTEEIADNSKSKNPRFLQSKDLPKDPKAGIRKLSPAVQEKMGYNSMSQKRMGLHQQKEERRFAQDKMMRTEGKLEKSKPSETYSNYKDFRGDMQKATIDDSTFKADSTEYAPGGTLKYDLPMKYQVRPNQSVAYNERFHKKGVEFMDRTSPDLDQDRKMPQDRAMQAGGSRPMHQATTSQIDPLTGMPLQANAPQMGNFSGFNEIPMYDQSMNPGAITQKRKLDEYKAKVDGSTVVKPEAQFKYMAGNTADSPESERYIKGANRLDRMAESGYYKKSYVDKRKKDAGVTLTSTLNPSFKQKK